MAKLPAFQLMDYRRSMTGMSVAELARRCGIDRKRLRYILDGQREMRGDEFLKLCVALRLDPRSFVTREMVEGMTEATRRSIGRNDVLGNRNHPYKGWFALRV